MASQAAKLEAMYSASTELNAIDLYFLLNLERVVDPTLKVQPKMLFLSAEPPTQFASVKP